MKTSRHVNALKKAASLKIGDIVRDPKGFLYRVNASTPSGDQVSLELLPDNGDPLRIRVSGGLYFRVLV